MHRIVAALVALVVVTAGIPASTVAQSAGGESVVSADADVSRLDAALATARGLADRAYTAVRGHIETITGDPASADAEADRLAAEINDHDAAYADHLTQLADEYNGSVANDTYVLDLAIDGEDSTEHVYVEVVGDGEAVTNVTAHRVQGSLTVDRSRELSATKARELTDDLEAYRQEYVADGETPEPAYFVRQASTYGNITELTT